MSKKHPAIKVASAKEGFRRAGHVFGIKPKTIALAALHPDAHAAIVADKSLVVVDTAVHLSAEEAAALPHHDADHVPQLTGRTMTDHIAVFDAPERLTGRTVTVDVDDASGFTLFGRVRTEELVGEPAKSPAGFAPPRPRRVSLDVV